MKILGASYAAQKNKTEASKLFNRGFRENPFRPEYRRIADKTEVTLLTT